MRTLTACSFAGYLTAACGPACAWGDMGHEVTGIIAYSRRSRVYRPTIDVLGRL